MKIKHITHSSGRPSVGGPIRFLFDFIDAVFLRWLFVRLFIFVLLSELVAILFAYYKPILDIPSMYIGAGIIGIIMAFWYPYLNVKKNARRNWYKEDDEEYP